MSSKNFVLLIGNVGSVEVKTFGEEGKFLVQASVATSEGYKDKSGEWKENTEWHKCIFAIPALAERAKGIQKGDKIEVTGSIRTNKWTDKDGNARSQTEISAVTYKTWAKAKTQDSPQAQPNAAPAVAVPSDDDDLPF